MEKGRRASHYVLTNAFLLLLIAFAGLRCEPEAQSQDPHGERTPETRAASLLTTYVTPHLQAELAAGTNVIWCGTFQLAWNAACALVREDLRLDGAPPMAAQLNRHTFATNSIDDASCVALAGFVRDDIHKQIQNSLNSKFSGRFSPRFVPNPGLTPRPQDIVAYACLFKDLRFPVAFERMDDSLTFRGVPVRAFGMANYKPAHETMYPQVQILDYRTEDDFIIELKTKSDGDRLILAKIQPSSTILDTITNIHQRIGQGKHEPAVRADEMIVPRINFDILREYSELQGRRLITTQPDVARDLRLVSAVQDTDFELNEQGVRLKSESHMAFACAKAETPVPTHKMIFDKPFLLLLQRANATQPYFVIWIDNAELLVR